MKKIILFLLLLSSLFGEAKFYIGSSYGMLEEEFTDDIDAQSSTSVVTVKAGYGVREAYAVELALEYIDTQSKIFSSNSDTEFDGAKYGMNVSLLKAFDLDIYILPFIKAGFGAGSLTIERIMQNKLYYGSFNVGTGFFIPIAKNFDFELGYDYKYTSYEAIDTIAEKLSYQSHINIAYLGLNVRF